MHFKKIFIFCLFGTLLFPSAFFAQQLPAQNSRLLPPPSSHQTSPLNLLQSSLGPRPFIINTFSIDTGYLNRKSGRAGKSFVLEAMGLYGLIFNHVSQSVTFDKWWARALFFVLPGALTKYINIATNVSFNQFGRNRAERALGYSAYSSTSPHNDYDKLVIWTAGVNSQMDLARGLAEKTYRYNNTFVNVTAYIFGKVAAHYYWKKKSRNRIHEILETPIYKKIKIGKNNTQFATALSLFLSSGFYSYLGGIWNYIAHGEAQIKPIEFSGVLLPEISYYFTTHGLSYLIESAYRFNETCYIPLGIEFVPSDSSFDEITVGIVKQFPNFYHITTDLRLRIGRAVSGSISIAYPLAHNIEISTGASLFNRKSPYGERNSPNLSSKNPYAGAIWVKGSLAF